MGPLTEIHHQEEEPVRNESRRELNSENLKAGIDLKEGTKPNFLLPLCISDTKLRPRVEIIEDYEVPQLVSMKQTLVPSLWTLDSFCPTQKLEIFWLQVIENSI